MNGEAAGSINTSPPPSLSLIIPSYNEARALPTTLHAAWSFLSAQPNSFELIVVDDGSEDATSAIATAFAASHHSVRMLSIPHGGKAAAVRAGLTAAAGQLVAFADADLATPLTYLTVFKEAIEQGCDIVIGSREVAGARRIGEPFYRHLMGRVFNGIVRILLLPGIHDTQCGFKLFNRAALHAVLDGARLYADPAATVTGARVTAFDVELLLVARRRGCCICAIPVVWTYGTNSKVHPARDTWHNLFDVLRVKANDLLGRYNG